MNNKLKALRASTEKFDEIEGFEIELKGLTFPETTKFAELVDKKETEEALNFLLFVTLRKSIPTLESDPENGMSDEDIKEEVKLMDGVKAMKLIKGIQKLSGLGVEEEKKE